MFEREDRDVTIVRRPGNDGQTPASLDGLARAMGAYVIFVDADDLLLPRCVEAHVYAHLSLRAHVGFTSGDMLQVADGQVVVAGGEDFNGYIRRRKRPEPARLPAVPACRFRPLRRDRGAAGGPHPPRAAAAHPLDLVADLRQLLPARRAACCSPTIPSWRACVPARTCISPTRSAP